MGKARSMGRRMSRAKQKGKRVYVSPFLYRLLAGMAKSAKVSIGKIVEDVLVQGVERINEQRKREEQRTQLVKVVPSLPGDRTRRAPKDEDAPSRGSVRELLQRVEE